MARADLLDFLARQRLKGNASFFSIQVLSKRLRTSVEDVREQANQLRSAPYFGLEYRNIPSSPEYRLKLNKLVQIDKNKL